MITLAVPVVVFLLGGIVYTFAKDPRAQEMGRLAFFVGLFVAVWAVGSEHVRLP
jgi:Na+/phosphate symporter